MWYNILVHPVFSTTKLYLVDERPRGKREGVWGGTHWKNSEILKMWNCEKSKIALWWVMLSTSGARCSQRKKARSSSLQSFSSHHKHQIYKVASCCTKVRIRPNARCLHCRLAQKCRQKKELHPAALSLLGMPLTPTSWPPWTLHLEFRWFSKISLKCRRLQSCFISLHLSKTSYLGGKAVSGSPVLTFSSQDADIQIIKKLSLLWFKESRKVWFVFHF